MSSGQPKQASIGLVLADRGHRRNSAGDLKSELDSALSTDVTVEY